MKLFSARLSALAASIALAAVTMVAAGAQVRDPNTPSEPTTKEGRCAKANGGKWEPKRHGWYTNDRLGYQQCLRK